MRRPNWIRPAILPQHAREIEHGPLFLHLCSQISKAYAFEGFLSNEISRLRATRLPVLPRMTWIEAMVQTEIGPAQASVALTAPNKPGTPMHWLTSGLRSLDGDINRLSDHATPQLTGSVDPQNWLNYAQIFCATIRENRALFTLCTCFDTLTALSRINPRQKAALREVFAPPRWIEAEIEAPRVAEVVIAYGQRLARAHLTLHENGRFEMLEEIEIGRLPPPRYVAGPKNWIYRRKDLNDD
ncbi:hypothetical protein [Albirhodobacter sp. R86504]|uniref:hypothetical protein n=1 Tax=Albirhodobacter sp. R86504 TaxID=3093848 RepID=UPI0036707A17